VTGETMEATLALSAIPPSAEVVIIGGGVIGTSCAFHLAEAGVGDIVLIERSSLGSGSTSKAAGGVRSSFTSRANIEMGLRSLEAYSKFSERPGQEIDLRRVGYLYLISQPEDVAAFEGGVALQNALGVRSRMIGPPEAKRLSPLIDTDGLLAAVWSPQDGTASPESVVLGYATGARRHGAVLCTGVTVTGIDVDAGEVTAVRTDAGAIRTGVVVCAAGAWSAQIGAMVGVDLPVTPYRRQVVFTEPIPELPDPLPMTIDFPSTFYFHREGRGLVLGFSDPEEQPGFNLDYQTEDWLPRLFALVERRAPSILDAGLTTGWAGLYEVTPDHNQIIGEDGEVSRFLYATGFSGHGFLMGPAVGEIIRDLYLGRSPFLDVNGFGVHRFSDPAAAVAHEHSII
jgi:sarcosine oxidase subunit beta